MTNSRAKALLAVILFAAFLLHAGKFLGFPPSVFPDERIYSTASVKGPLAESVIPNFLFYAVYGVTGWFGDYFDAARILNAFFFVLSGVFVYGIARMASGPRLSLLAAALSVFLPFAWYTVYFMPESLFYTLFWALAWMLLRYRDAVPWKLGVAAGAIMGASSLVKAHATFWCLGFALYIAATGWQKKRIKESAVAITAAAAAFLATKLGLGALIAGPAGLTLFGNIYNRWAAESAASISPFEFLWLAVYNAWGHLLVLLVLFGPALILTVRVALNHAPESGENRAAHRWAVLTLCFFIPLLAIDVLFTATVAVFLPNVFPPESTVVQTRYYSFLYPALLIVCAQYLGRPAEERKEDTALLRGLCAATVVLAVFAAFTRFGGYTFYFPHSPEIAFFLRSWPSLVSIGIIALAALPGVAALRGVAAACKAFLYIFIPALCVYTTVAAPRLYVEQLDRFDPYAFAGSFYREFLGEEVSDMTIYDVSEHLGPKLLHFLGEPDVAYHSRYNPGPADLSLLKPGSKWIVVNGGITLPEDRIRFIVFISERGPALVRIADFSYSVDLSHDSQPWPIIEAAAGTDEIRVSYALPLPNRFTAELVFAEGEDGGTQSAAYTLQAGEKIEQYAAGEKRKDIVARVGGKTLTLRKTSDSPAPMPIKILITPRSRKTEYSAQELLQ